MSTQKIPRPHIFTPPDFILITRDDFGRRVKKPLIGRYEVTLVGRAPNSNSFFPEVLVTPKDVRGVTRVDYVHVERATSNSKYAAYGEGIAYLHTPDIFVEHFGVSLATIRAVTDLIERQKPVNARDILTYIGRWQIAVVSEYGFTESEAGILLRAANKLEAAVNSCPK
jgi:hypothetical protein